MIKKALYIASIISILFNNGMSVYANSSFDETFFNLNNIIYYDAGNEECIPGGSTALVGNDNIEKVWNFFKSKGIPDTGIAGILGGKWGETGGTIDPTAIQSGQLYNESRAMSNEYGYAFGIAQWDGPRRPALINYAKSKGKQWDDLSVQLDFMWEELNTNYADVLAVVKTGTLEEVVRIWVGGNGFGYERPAEEHIAPRNAEGVKVGRELLATFAGKSSSSQNSTTSYTFIGDSLTVGVKNQLESTFPGSDIRAEVGQGVQWSLSQANNTKDNVIINLGTNDKFEGGSSLLEKLKDKKVFIIDIYGIGGNTDYEATNKNILDTSKNFPNVEVLSWKSYLDSNGGREKYYAEDGYHMNEEGKSLYIKFLQENLNKSSSSSNECIKNNFSQAGSVSSTTKDGFPIFLQTDSRWANEKYTPYGFTMRKEGCGPTSFSIIASALGVSVNPLDIAKKSHELGAVHPKDGAYNDQAIKLSKYYSLNAEQIDISVSEINKRLDQGQLIWAGGRGMQPPFTDYGHIVVIRKKTPSGNWLIANPYDYPDFNIPDHLLDPMHEWNPSDIVRSMNTATAVWK